MISTKKLYGLNDNTSVRPSWEHVYMMFAHSLAGRSTCSRNKVGCVVVSSNFNRVLSIGYNGNYKRGPNTCDSTEKGACGCLHAEDNALLKMDYNDPCRKVMFVTVSPCVICAKRIINADVDEVYYDILYRDRTGLDLLRNNGVEIYVSQPFKDLVLSDD